MESVTKAAKAKVQMHLSPRVLFFFSNSRYTARDAFADGTWPMRLATYRFRYMTGT